MSRNEQNEQYFLAAPLKCILLRLRGSVLLVLRDNNLFQMAVRKICHPFFHGGPCLSGLSVLVVILLTDGTIDSAASALILQDCPDMDHRETISFLKPGHTFND